MQAAGATHLLHVSPMYNKPPQRGLVAHFRAVAEATDLPIVVYNVPGRTGSNIEAATTLALAESTRVVAVKEASGNLGQIDEIIRHRPAHFAVLSGDDAMTLAVMASGGDGVISVTSNATPARMVQLVEAAARGDWAAATCAPRRAVALDGGRLLRVQSHPRQGGACTCWAAAPTCCACHCCRCATSCSRPSAPRWPRRRPDPDVPR
jgi:4-hydroxy-tetrahydrodipicolinate synthase